MNSSVNNVKVVIGSQYGDEGKGLTVDYLASKFESSLVTRFSGGAQASHSVVRNGTRHAFRHFGSNSFLPNSSTYLSNFFICNPYIFEEEVKDLGFVPNIIIHPQSTITTMVDMAINQAVELARSGNKHGSCGLGINETVERNLSSDYGLTVMDLSHPDLLINKLISIREEWLPLRLEQHGLAELPKMFVDALDNWSVNDEMELICKCYQQAPKHTSSGLPQDGNHILEGSQGLMLSERWCHVTPHVTRSYTGTRNVLDLTKGVGHHDLYYVSRVYTTRHGNGPLANEVDGLLYPNICDPNNVPNEHQGTIRYAPLDLGLLTRSIYDDLPPEDVNYTLNVVLTCVDQLDDDHIRYIFNGKEHYVPFKTFLGELARVVSYWNVPTGKLLLSYGPSADTMIELSL